MSLKSTVQVWTCYVCCEFKHSPKAASTHGVFSTKTLQLRSKSGGWNYTLNLENPPQSKQLHFTQTIQRHCQHAVATWKQSKQSTWGSRKLLAQHCNPLQPSGLRWTRVSILLPSQLQPNSTCCAWALPVLWAMLCNDKHHISLVSWTYIILPQTFAFRQHICLFTWREP